MTVPPGIFLDAFMRVNKQQSGFGLRGGAGDHVLQKLLVARGVNDDVLALGGVKQICGINRDVLVTLGLECIHQVRPLERHAAALGNFLKLVQFAIGQRTRVVEQPAHKRGLAVISMPDDHDFELLGRDDGLAHGMGVAWAKSNAGSTGKLARPLNMFKIRLFKQAGPGDTASSRRKQRTRHRRGERGMQTILNRCDIMCGKNLRCNDGNGRQQCAEF